jgi:predicted glycoside hydrolase/deacetylase ChbG (UPF0249 family)
MTRPTLIVADDLGSAPYKTDAILATLESGLITHASMMSTSNDFDRACALVHDRGIGNRIGVHLSLSEGTPLTDGVRQTAFCDAEGRFQRLPGSGRLMRLGAHRDVVARELHAQAVRILDSGLMLAHVDSHHHVHIQPAISLLVVRIARELGVPRVRLAPNMRRSARFGYRLYARAHNRRLRRLGLATTRYVGSLPQFLRLAGTIGPAGDYELVVHPVLGENGQIEDQDRPGESLAALLDECFPEPPAPPVGAAAAP